MPGKPQFIPELHNIADPRGRLFPIEEFFGQPVRRVFYITDVPPNTDRAGHAHIECHQMLIAVSGSFWVEIGNEVRQLNSPHSGLYIPPGNYIRLYDFSAGAVCLVICSHIYNPDEYLFGDETIENRLDDFARRENELDYQLSVNLAGSY